MTASEAIQQMMLATPAVYGKFPGGIYVDTEIEELSKTQTPDAFAPGGRIITCAFVKSGNKRPAGAPIHSFRELVEIYMYQAQGTGDIQQAADLLFKLLNGEKVEGSYEVRYASTTTGGRDVALDSNVLVDRYEVVRKP